MRWAAGRRYPNRECRCAKPWRAGAAPRTPQIHKIRQYATATELIERRATRFPAGPAAARRMDRNSAEGSGLFPVLRRQSESLALGYVTVRVVESCLIAVGIVSLLAVVTLRQDLAGGAGTDNASLILSGRSLVAVHDATFLLGPAFCAAIGNGLILGYLMLRSGLVPRRLAQLGLVGGSLALVTALLVLFGAYDQSSAASFFLTVPEAVWELSLGIYLIARGFKASPILYDDGLRAGVDGPLVPLVAAPVVAAQ
jgi:hypothetical protein